MALILLLINILQNTHVVISSVENIILYLFYNECFNYKIILINVFK